MPSFRAAVAAEVLFRIVLLITLFSAADYIRRGKRMLLESAAA